VSTSAIVGVAGPSAGGFLEPRMTGLQPLLELDRHKHAHLTCLVNPWLGNLIGLQFLVVDLQPETDVGCGGPPLFVTATLA
jgi:hypothetical protein